MPVRSISSRGRAGRQHAPRVHRHDPVPALRLVHVGGGDDDAHARAAGADVVDQRPELPPRERIDAGGRLVEDQQVRDRGPARRTGRPSASCRPRACRPGGRRTGPSPVASSSSLTRTLRSRGRQPEQPRHEVDVVVDAELEVEVLAQALRHVRDARADGAPVPDVGDVAAEDGRPCPPASSSSRRSAPAASTCRRRRGRRCRP